MKRLGDAINNRTNNKALIINWKRSSTHPVSPGSRAHARRAEINNIIIINNNANQIIVVRGPVRTCVRPEAQAEAIRP